ncbi:AAA family ATPase [Geomonas sp. Red32]|uniref:bifunctional aminoglycoside phosphotransferase/ATP-binding protein n=1 Tax=Geomonas sp. Red32 TaxID=2912856 RepID=UPI00202D0B13|nr:AAA family ATPase [Geomonas sp. Red32]MCM0083423.1 AAA family ATPase [Geomonas sp. Red32]
MAYPEPTAEVRLIETHVSFLFLTDRFVYKVKKAVDLGFLDFTTLEKRLYYCHEELRLNRRLCPDTYLGVVELHRTGDQASFRPEGELIDYAVKMRRLPEERMLNRLLERGEASFGMMERLARRVADFHLAARRAPEIDACGTPELLGVNWEDNLRQVEPFIGATISRRDHTLVGEWVRAFLDQRRDLLESRVAQGFIRECDGDLHSGNICLTDTICIFDCIEFNERFRYTDTAADIGFLLMDLEYAGHREFCAPFLATYRVLAADSLPEPLLTFYRANRAFIRGKVMSIRSGQEGVTEAERNSCAGSAARYFNLCRGFILRERLEPSLIVTCGMTGSGKSALSGELALQLGIRRERSDAVRKEMAAQAKVASAPHPPAPPLESEATSASRGTATCNEGIYTPEWDRATYAELALRACEELSAGRPVVIDATFRRRADRDIFRKLAEDLEVPFVVLETSCPVEVIRERLEKRLDDPREISDARWETYPQLASEYEPPAPGESITVDSSLPLADVVERALEGMGLLT